MVKIFIFWFLIFIEIIFISSYTVYIISLIYSSIKGSFFVPTSNKKLDQIFSLIDFHQKKTFLDLGSGDGRIVFYIAKKFPWIKAIGLEVNPLLIFISNIFKKIQKINNCQFYKSDLTKNSLPKADIVYLFLMPKLIELIKLKILKLFNNGSLIISHGFKVPYLKENLIKKITDKTFCTYYYLKH